MKYGLHGSTFRLECAHLSDLGMRRMNNQDSLAVVVTEDRATWCQRGHLLMVADGMGAHAAGELASKLAADVISHTYFKLRDLYPPAALRQAIREANTLIYSKGQSSVGFQGMGTTCTCLVLLPQGALVAHVGDSRVYRLRGRHLAQLTFDHSLVWEMAAAGHIAQEDVPAFIPKNVITRSLGPHPAVNIDVEGPYDAANGDVFLVCSDGLSGQIPDPELGALLHCLTPAEAVQTLVDVANLRGGPDNISVVVARVVGDGAGSERDGGNESPGGERVPLRQTAVQWAATAACLAGIVYSLLTEHWAAAGLIAVGLAAVWLVPRFRRLTRRAACSPAQSIGGPYGNGPYRETTCGSNQKVVDSLAAIAQKLRNLPESNGLRIDWKPLEEHGAAAKTAAGAGDYCTAIKHYSHAIRDIMRQLRQQRTNIGDSGVGLI